MKVVFLGVGEAFDENLANNSHVLLSQTKLLLDCGYAIPRLLWTRFPDSNFLDAIYISHAHADHYMGLPIVLARMTEEGRTRPLQIIAQPSVIEQLPSLFDHAYRHLLEESSFPIEFVHARRGRGLRLNEFTLNFALSRHVISNYAVRVDCNGRSVCYSGDGAYTDATKELYRRADLVIHETYSLEPEIEMHANVTDVMAMCEEVGVQSLAPTHFIRDLRKDKERILSYVESRAGRVRVFVPEPLEEFSFP